MCGIKKEGQGRFGMDRSRIPNFFQRNKKEAGSLPYGETDALERLMAEAYGFFRQKEFRSMISRERKRTERTGKPFLLLFLDLTAALETLVDSHEHFSDRIAIHNLVQTLSEVTRDIDVRGWYEQGRVVGIVFTDTAAECAEAVLEKVKGHVLEILGEQRAARIAMSYYCFPQDCSDKEGRLEDGNGGKAIMRFYPDPQDGSVSRMVSLFFKRTLDVVGCIAGFILFLPIFIIVPILIKIDSKGPVFFRQERVGLKGRRFIFYKFRSMYVDGDDSIHRDYVRKLIKKQGDSLFEKQGDSVYKITDDPRVTPVGRFLRRTSLDELPQFVNVFLGNMSLVGPRPAIPYEIEDYEMWHRCRLLEVKPGITGIWQVEGRSRTTFDGMVRMDLQYGRRRNLLLDLKLIFRTPLALLSAKGAY